MWLLRGGGTWKCSDGEGQGRGTAKKFYFLWHEKRKRGIAIRDICKILDFPFNPFELGSKTLSVFTFTLEM